VAVDLPLGWMRQIIGASPRRLKAAQHPPGCRGSFWHPTLNKLVTVDLGDVLLRPVPVFRVASLEDEPKNILSWELGFSEEGATQNTKYSTKAKGNSVRVLCNTRTNSHGREFSC